MEGVYGHIDHRVISGATTYAFNNNPDSKVLLYLAVSESVDNGYGFTKGKGQPSKGFDVVHKIADEAINYLVDVTDYIDTKVQSLQSYQSQFRDPELAHIQHNLYERANCIMESVPFSCEQFILGGIKRNLNADEGELQALINLAN